MAADPSQYFVHTISNDFFRALCKTRLGGGCFREVFVWEPAPEMVVKFETSGEEFQNIVEWKVWDSAPPWLRRWLAPCIKISPWGTVLWQSRCDPITIDRIPKKIPAILTDYHEANWGLFENRPVLFDYGFLYGILKSIPKDMKEIDKETIRTVKKKKVVPA